MTLFLNINDFHNNFYHSIHLYIFTYRFSGKLVAKTKGSGY